MKENNHFTMLGGSLELPLASHLRVSVLVSHKGTAQRIGRTLGPVWRAIRRLEVEPEPTCHAFGEVRPLRSN
jgi:hypothetical protein